MKQFILYFVITLSALYSANAQNQNSINLLKTTISQMENARSPEDWKQIRSRFERITATEPAYWLPIYYQALTDIELSFRMEDLKDKEQYLADGDACLEKIKKLKVDGDKERSEINTLRGYLYFAKMAIDPGANGPKYAGIVMSYYGEALKQNPENPRAILLNAYFQNNMSAYMGGSYPQFNADIEKATALFDKENQDSVMPHWGRNRKY